MKSVKSKKELALPMLIAPLILFFLLTTPFGVEVVGQITSKITQIATGERVEFKKPPEVLGATDTQVYPGFIYVIPQLLKAFTENDDIADSETSPGGGVGGGGGGGIPNLPDLDLELPDGITNQVVIGSTTYYQLPPSPNYDIYTCPGRTYGLPEMLAVLNTVGKAYNRTYPDGKLYIGDINATGHKSHNWGVAVDIVTTDMDSMMDSASYNPERAKALARMFVATNKIKNIWFCDESVTEDALSFARQNNYSLENAYCIEGHYDHFHVDITTERGDWYTPGC